MGRGEAEDAGGLTPVKDDNEAAPHFTRRTLLVFNCFDDNHPGLFLRGVLRCFTGRYPLLPPTQRRAGPISNLYAAFLTSQINISIKKRTILHAGVMNVRKALVVCPQCPGPGIPPNAQKACNICADGGKGGFRVFPAGQRGIRQLLQPKNAPFRLPMSEKDLRVMGQQLHIHPLLAQRMDLIQQGQPLRLVPDRVKIS